MSNMFAPIVLFLSLASIAHAAPSQIHIALGGSDTDGNSDKMYVAWFTQDATTTSSVRYGHSANDLATSANGTSVQYLEDHGYHHVCLLQTLVPATRYFYQVGDFASATWSEVFSFESSPASTQGFSMAIFGDMGYEDSDKRPMLITKDGLVKTWSATYTRNLLEDLKNNKSIDMVWHVGDIGYMDDAFAHHPASMAYEKAYNGYMNWLQNVTAAMPYMVSPGNHESECHSPICIVEHKKYGLPLSNFTAFNTRWHMPSGESKGHPKSNMWYSWNYGPVHFVSINTETDFPGAEEEGTGDGHFKNLPAGGFGAKGEYLRWLEADLKAANEARGQGGRPWIIAGGHRPYSDIETYVAPLFEKYGVDLYFAGHGHSYSRSMPAVVSRVDRGQRHDSYVKPNGTVWIMAGGAGCDEMAQQQDDPSFLSTNKYLQNGGAAPPNSTAFTSGRYAAGVLDVTPVSLHWRLIDSVTRVTIDELTITR